MSSWCQISSVNLVYFLILIVLQSSLHYIIKCFNCNLISWRLWPLYISEYIFIIYMHTSHNKICKRKQMKDFIFSILAQPHHEIHVADEVLYLGHSDQVLEPYLLFMKDARYVSTILVSPLSGGLIAENLSI